MSGFFKFNKKMAKIRKDTILSLVDNGSTLVKKFDSIYNVYFYIILMDATIIYNVNFVDCKNIIKNGLLKKTMVKPNHFEYTKF